MKNQILALLEKDSRLTAAKIATMLGQKEEDVAKAIRELERDNVILGYNTFINWELVGSENITALIELKITPQRNGFDAVAEKIYRFPQVKTVILMSGSYDLLVTVEGKNLKEIARFVAERLAPMDDVISTATHFQLKTYKDFGVIYTEKAKDDREVMDI